MKLLRLFILMTLLLAATSCGRKAAPAPLPPSTAAGPAVTLGDINRALNAWMQEHSHYPKDLQELADAKLIARLPPPPPGKKYVINQQTVKVELAEQ